MRPARLLAKGSRSPAAPREAETLPGHVAAVTRIARLLAERWGDSYLASLGLDAARFGPWLRLALPRAAVAHDLGKASDHFQSVVRRDREVRAQAGWHEHLSLWLLLAQEPLAHWLLQSCEPSLRFAVLVAVLGHHLRVEDGSAVQLSAGSGALRLILLLGHADFAAALRESARLLELGEPPALSDVTIDLLEPARFDRPVRDWLLRASRWWAAAEGPERRFVAALKALLVAVDAAGSALPRHGEDAASWVERALANVTASDVLEEVASRGTRGATPRPFQQEMAATPARLTFVRAGCGSGKTAGAYLWAARHGRGRKLFFCYPTTGTASQGFADYVPPDQFEAALAHSRSSADLEDLLEEAADAPDGLRSRIDWLLRFAALATWDAPITVCTADAVLGLIQSNRQGLFSFAPIANGAFVFDEVHQYDDRLFGALLRFLEALRGAPVLLMTASMPQARLAALRGCAERLGERLTVVDGPADLEALKRYRLERAEPGAAWERVVAAIAAGQRVLWVANTVDRAAELAREAERRSLPCLLYHSRYRYADRLRHHSAVVAALGESGAGSVLAITTHVCEVSLDISAGLLITELAPIAALVQRLGRLNRRVLPGGVVLAALACVVEPAGPAPYSPEDLADARRWLDLLGGEPVSQADLAATLDRVLGGTALPPRATSSAWLDDGVQSAAAPLRESTTTIPVVREEDARALSGLPADRRRRELIRLTIPMLLGPVAREIAGWRRLGGALVAPTGRLIYDERLGGRWR